MFFPDQLEVMRRCLLHDLGEAGTADVGSGAKRKYPKLRKALKAAEAIEFAELGIPAAEWELTKTQELMVQFCDKLDAYMWMMHHKDSISGHSDWVEEFQRLKVMAAELGVVGIFDVLVEDMYYGW
jgi:5'-deoxynucleotidase YfbR-like HD superfamily hydrolase